MPLWNIKMRTGLLGVLVGVPFAMGTAGCDDAQDEGPAPIDTLTPPIAVSTASPSAQRASDDGEPEKLSDFAIGEAVEQELALDDGVPQHRVYVEVDNGVVTLSGTVPHLLAQRRAVERSEMVRGVRSVVNNIDVLEDDRSEAAIYKDVMEAIAVHPATEAFEVDVSNTGGTVTLLGKVDSWAERNLVETVVASVQGVTKINNDIDVDYDTSRSDEEIREDVEARLANDLRVFDDKLKVHVKDGVVTLTGTVASAAERRRAYADAWVAGAKDVSTEAVRVKWWEKHVMRRPVKDVGAEVLDEQAEKAIKEALSVDPRVIGENPRVHVNVVDGTATLTGDVPSYDSKYAAEQDALNTVGVWQVRNLLKVRPVPVVSDDDLEKRIDRALDRNPYIDHLSLRAYVENGQATLYGEVENEFQREQANWVAGQIDGVVDVRDALRVIPSDTPVSDYVLRADVLHQLAWDPFVDAEDVEVEVHDGVVTLSGTVQDWRAHDAAVRNAREAGARRLLDELNVRDGPVLFAPPAKTP